MPILLAYTYLSLKSITYHVAGVAVKANPIRPQGASPDADCAQLVLRTVSSISHNTSGQILYNTSRDSWELRRAMAHFAMYIFPEAGYPASRGFSLFVTLALIVTISFAVRISFASFI